MKYCMKIIEHLQYNSFDISNVRLWLVIEEEVKWLSQTNKIQLAKDNGVIVIFNNITIW